MFDTAGRMQVSRTAAMSSVGFYQMAKIAVIPTVVLAEFILFRKTISFKKFFEHGSLDQIRKELVDELAGRMLSFKFADVWLSCNPEGTLASSWHFFMALSVVSIDIGDDLFQLGTLYLPVEKVEMAKPMGLLLATRWKNRTSIRF
uniref:Birch protein n=1 Tax=Betula platyphylla TaxID=78630 RepID=A0A9E9L5Q3_BETPL|nr:birch protein [Betula platyphylla]